jgi:menaquinone-dependent protoporphyrinogen IX oxidase
MEEQGIEVDCVNTEDVQVDTLTEYDLTAIVGPKRMFGMSKPMGTFIKNLEHVDLLDKKAFAFDTKFGSRFSGSAEKEIEKSLKKLGLNIVKKHALAIVEGGEAHSKTVWTESLFKLELRWLAS